MYVQTTYRRSLNWCFLQVLRYYTKHGGVSEDTGFVEIRRTDNIADGPSHFLLHGAPAINHCMYRNMYRFRHIIVVDFDEVFITHCLSLEKLGLLHLDIKIDTNVHCCIIISKSKTRYRYRTLLTSACLAWLDLLDLRLMLCRSQWSRPLDFIEIYLWLPPPSSSICTWSPLFVFLTPDHFPVLV